MRRCHVGEFGDNAFEQTRLHAVSINRDGNDPCSNGFERMSSQYITWVFDNNGIPGIQKDSSAKVDPLLRPVNDHNLLLVAPDTPRTPHVGSQGLSQFQRSKGIAILQCFGSDMQRIDHGLSPSGLWEVHPGDITGAEVGL